MLQHTEHFWRHTSIIFTSIYFPGVLHLNKGCNVLNTFEDTLVYYIYSQMYILAGVLHLIKSCNVLNTFEDILV